MSATNPIDIFLKKCEDRKKLEEEKREEKKKKGQEAYREAKKRLTLFAAQPDPHGDTGVFYRALSHINREAIEYPQASNEEHMRRMAIGDYCEKHKLSFPILESLVNNENVRVNFETQKDKGRMMCTYIPTDEDKNHINTLIRDSENGIVESRGFAKS